MMHVPRAREREHATCCGRQNVKIAADAWVMCRLFASESLVSKLQQDKKPKAYSLHFVACTSERVRAMLKYLVDQISFLESGIPLM